MTTRSPKANAKPYSVTDAVSLDDIEALAREVDQINKANPEPEKKARRIAGEGPDRKDRKGKAIEPDAVIPPPDPEFLAMVAFGTNAGIDWMKEALRLMEPGMTTREKVGFAVGRLAQRLAPIEGDTWIADLSIVAGYLAFWWLVGRLPPEEKPNGQTGPRPLINGNNG